jgi:hypothetical protein
VPAGLSPPVADQKIANIAAKEVAKQRSCHHMSRGSSSSLICNLKIWSW